MKTLSNFEDTIKTLLGDEGQHLPKGFTTEIFAHLNQLLVKEGNVTLSALGTFLYQEREDSTFKISFMPSSYLRQELNKKEQKQQQAIVSTDPSIDVIQKEETIIQEDLGKSAVEPEPPNDEIKLIDTTNEKVQQADIGIKKNAQLGIWNDMEEVPVANRKEEVIKLPIQEAPSFAHRPPRKSEPSVSREVIPEPIAPKKPPVYVDAEDEKTFNSKRIWYIILILLLLIGLGFGVYKYLPTFFGQQSKAKRFMGASIDVFSIPEGCIAYETLKDNDTLLGLATKYYGNSCYWVYIFLENKQELKYGSNAIARTSIRIPQLNDYGITDPKESDSIKKALALSGELCGNSLK